MTFESLYSIRGIELFNIQQYTTVIACSVSVFQARAPNSPVIIVGTHVDQVFSNPERFPQSYLEELNVLIKGNEDVTSRHERIVFFGFTFTFVRFRSISSE